MLLADLGNLLVRGIGDPDPRVEATDFDLAQLRVLRLPPRLEDAALVYFAVPFRERDVLLAIEPRVATAFSGGLGAR